MTKSWVKSSPTYSGYHNEHGNKVKHVGLVDLAKGELPEAKLVRQELKRRGVKYEYDIPAKSTMRQLQSRVPARVRTRKAH